MLIKCHNMLVGQYHSTRVVRMNDTEKGNSRKQKTFFSFNYYLLATSLFISS